MGKINLLSSKIYNRIAAGEVVERPFSVVKELVENSIDAGATKIKIEIENGGISSIIITDNGQGIEKSDLKKALMPHATSKISNLNDLDNILTLGFRGEALASIASVSKITITSKPKEQDIGAQIIADGGEILSINDCAAVDGTEIAVKNLFYNTPVREKFLHSERSEENEISNTVARFILGNPKIAFELVADGKQIYQSYGDGFESAMVCVYGAEIINNFLYIDTERNGIKINGYVGKHNFTKGNRSYQTTFLNGRYVVNQTISAAISNAYSAYMMKRQYPVYVLSLNIPTEIVDVNVHPNKLDVRFANNQIIYGSIYTTISKVLDGSSEALNIVTDNKQNNKQFTNEYAIDYATHNGILKEIKLPKDEQINVKKFDKLVFCDSLPQSENNFEKIDYKIKDKEPVIDIFAENKAFIESLDRKKNSQNFNKEMLTQQKIEVTKELNYIGQALNTYLIFDDGVDIYIADQHAAHERILFDKLLDSQKNNDIITQPLLIPYILNVNNLEYEFLASKIDTLNKIGIEIFEFGRNSFKVSSIPTFLTEMNIQKFFDSILTDLDGLKDITVNDILLEKLAQKACKAAIKSGDKLSQPEIDILTEKLKENLGLKCPHGRPVAIKITRTEIDKWFKRIV